MGVLVNAGGLRRSWRDVEKDWVGLIDNLLLKRQYDSHIQR